MRGPDGLTKYCITYLMLGLSWGGCLAVRLTKFFIISDGSLILGIRGDRGDGDGASLWDSLEALGESGGNEPDCHTHLIDIQKLLQIYVYNSFLVIKTRTVS